MLSYLRASCAWQWATVALMVAGYAGYYLLPFELVGLNIVR